MYLAFNISLCQIFDEEEQEKKLLALGDPSVSKIVDDLIYIRARIQNQIPVNLKTNYPSAQISANFWNPEFEDLKRYARFAGSAYCVKPTLKTWTCSHCLVLGSGIRVENIFEDSVTGTRGYIAIDSRKKNIILAFRGSSNVRNFFFDFLLVPSPYTMEDGTKTYIHKGFHVASNNLKPKYLPSMKSLIAKYPDYQIVVTGHSLGGSMATMAFVELHRETQVDWGDLFLYTYGEPVIGETVFVDWLQKRSNNMIRVVNNNDIVPNINLPGMIFVNHVNEIWLNQFKAYRCKTGPRIYQDKACLPQFGISIVDHLTYFEFYTGVGC